jgi:threonine aldolase
MAYAPARFDDALIRVNLFSDTQTRPSRAMREAMLDAPVGDEQHGADPTINALCERAADLLGKEAAVFMPTGTMCNQAAMLTWCRPGDEILAHESAHILTSEGGGVAALSGAQITGLRGARGQFDVATLEAGFRDRSRYEPPQRLVAVEQTANFAGGTVWPLDALDAVAACAHAQGLATHMDGARMMNAVVASGTSAAAMSAGWDSVWLDFTKGLGAPLGAVLAGPQAFIDDVWRWKQRLGGALRQGGLCAAGCLHALDHNVERLAEDHENARLLARGLAGVAGLEVELPETNLVYFDTSGTGMEAAALADALVGQGVAISVMGRYRGRACTHLDVDRAGVSLAETAFHRVVGAAASARLG